ncbi:MAG TPA: hypothetical protein IGS17_13390 [Oscillatoriales cyanobacterium M59_W2019_021]|nr:MAG: hypothetical protein D6728_17510 [Cyanobacteria bacterium J055]HIK30713.1 hypothetical protein [Oscillatoriales cyanobacterium M4454_W2019_049]HIK51899.1 hypothetical protein [Oscillatoriales cyanobacterium M59_W2019_021]
MTPNPTIMQAVEQLDYRATIGDVATHAGLELDLAERGLLALASEAGGHLQVAETGDIVYQFPKNFRAILRNKYWQLQWQETWQKIWRVLFYLIRISFGTILIASIVLIFLTIAIILIAASSSRDDNGGGGSRSGGGGGFVFFPHYWLSDIWYFFSPNYNTYEPRGRRQKVEQPSPKSNLNFLEAVFSFLFGDGNPNADREERRAQEVGTVIRNHQGAVVAEQIAPYLDDLGNEFARDTEDYMLPVLVKFNGRPEVSPDGQIVYHFPELQISAAQRKSQPVPAYFRERLWRFSQASSGQVMMAIGLGALNFVGALVLGALLRDGAIVAELGGLVAFVNSIYWLLLAYGTAFLTIPLIRYFWIQWRNRAIDSRNQQRQERVTILTQAPPHLQQKLDYARQFAAETVIGKDDLAYTTETDLAQQELDRADKIDAEWQRRLESGS